MPRENLSFFDEKRSVVEAVTEWGSWWQTVQEVHVKIKLPQGTTSDDIVVEVNPKHIRCLIKEKPILEGELPRTVYSDEMVWTIEDGNLCIVLAKSDYSVKEDVWESLLADGSYRPDAWTLHEMRKNLDLERFQIENPGMDFSKAQLSKHYDKLPGWSRDRTNEMKAESESVCKKN